MPAFVRAQTPSGVPPRIDVLLSPTAGVQLAAARARLSDLPPSADVLVVGATRDAADAVALAAAAAGGATFGVRRAGWRALCHQLASEGLIAADLVPASGLALEALAARITFEALSDREAPYLAGVAGRPGFVRALVSTLNDVRLGDLSPSDLAGVRPTGPDLAALAARFERALDSARLADHATVLRIAAERMEGGPHPWADWPMVLVDVPVRSALERRVLRALLERAGPSLVTIPEGDGLAYDALATIAGARLVAPAAGGVAMTDLTRLQRDMFAVDPPVGPAGRETGDVTFVSAPGEPREAVEIARRVLVEAATGVPFDRMAVLVRAPEVYGAHLEAAFARAGVPAWFARGTRRPDPAGRALLALLACASERLSAARFAEYVSLGQVPTRTGRQIAPSAGPDVWIPPADEALDLRPGSRAEDPTGQAANDAVATDLDAASGPQQPWRWERLLNDAAVVGTRDRWHRRLEGLSRELRARRAELQAEDPDAPRVRGLDRDVAALDELRAFALPVIDTLAALPDAAPWGAWLELLEPLARGVLRRPQRVLALLGDLRPMAAAGEVTLSEVRAVLAGRLMDLPADPPADASGRVFVAPPDLARGRAFDVVFVPGLAERLFPRRSREDPLLLDDARRRISPELPTLETLNEQERLQLRLAVGAATRRLHGSYPRLEVASARPRVPSFYALDLERARSGVLPPVDALVQRAAEAVGARLAWPAPPDARLAIDAAEYDLATLAGLLARARDGHDVRGGARYLLELNEALGRTLRTRYARWEKKRPWSPYDGLCQPARDAGPTHLTAQDDRIRAALARHRLSARAYSPSALQRYAACPYRFYLSAVLRLEPRSGAGHADRLDPLTRGRLFHETQAACLRTLMARSLVPVRPASLPTAFEVLDDALTPIAAAFRDALAPAVDRVWADEIAGIRADLRAWLVGLAEAGESWVPAYVEFGFGFAPGEGRDPASQPDPVTLPGGWKLHGIVDLVERHAAEGSYRVTDHKTGRARASERFVVQGGEMLQPVLYGLAIEAALGPVTSSRLSFCTELGRHRVRELPLTPDSRDARRRGREVLEIVDRAVDQAFFPPAPRAGACERCDYRTVCGPHEERRARRKRGDPRLGDLEALRGFD